MKKDKVAVLLQAVKSKITGERAGTWVEAYCPFIWNHGGKDQHPSFGVKINTNSKSICKCWSCGYGGDLQDLVLDLAQGIKKHQLTGYNLKLAVQLTANELEDMDINPEDIPDYDAVIEPTEVIIPEYWLDSFRSVELYPKAMQYLDSRGVEQATIKTLDIRYDPLQRRVCFPFRNFKGDLVGVQGRSLDAESTLRYYQYGYNSKRNGHSWYGESRVNFDKPVVLVEGVFDYIKVMQVYDNVMASFTSGLSVQKIKRVAEADSIVSFYDYGSGGNAARLSLTKKLAKTPMVHLTPTEQEDDCGAMTLEQVTLHLKGHVKLSGDTCKLTVHKD